MTHEKGSFTQSTIIKQNNYTVNYGINTANIRYNLSLGTIIFKKMENNTL